MNLKFYYKSGHFELVLTFGIFTVFSISLNFEYIFNNGNTESLQFNGVFHGIVTY